MSDAKPLDFTGERFTPECVREIWYEHWHRYAFARGLARGKRVLDAACGEGYGSNLLADVASDVLGLDLSAAAIEHARARYGQRPNLRFDIGDCTALTLPDRSVDLVVSFETLEHVVAQEALVDGFARVLADGGALLISSPDKKTYTEQSGFRNEYHVRELYREELLALLGARFAHVRLYGQKLLFQSTLWALDGGASAEIVTAASDGSALASKPDYPPLYYIALCSQQPLPDKLPALSLFGDREESVYAHYNHEVRKNMAAGARIAELEAELARARAASASEPTPISEPRPWWRRLLR